MNCDFRIIFCTFAEKYTQSLISNPFIMAYNPNKDLKKYYGIAEVAEQFNVAESLLRYWEKEFQNIKPRKNGRGVRQYTKEDIEEVRIVYNLLKVRGMKIAAAKAVLTKNHKAASDTSEVIGRLQSIKSALQDISHELGEL